MSLVAKMGWAWLGFGCETAKLGQPQRPHQKMFTSNVLWLFMQITQKEILHFCSE